MTRLITHIYFSPITHSSRLMRAIECALAENLADQGEIVGYMDADFVPDSYEGKPIRVHLLNIDVATFLPRLASRLLGWIKWSWLTARHIRATRPIVIQAHSLAAMPAAVLAKAFTKIPILYDAHELESERAGWGPLQRMGARLIERLLIKKADQILVVSKTISEWYENAYQIERPALVRNMPKRSVTQNVTSNAVSKNAACLRRNLGIPDQDILYVYLGNIGYGRGITILLEAFSSLPKSYHFCALGYGDFADKVIEAAKKNPNIHFQPAVPSESVMEFIRNVDVGVSLGEDICLSYRYSLPNKIFETRLAGLPVLSSNLPEMANFVATYGGGWVVEPEPKAVAALVQSIDHEDIKNIMRDIRDVPTWEDDVPVYLHSLRKTIAANTLPH
jgi:glycosyltransferase involved in cell wall biosynthesis